MNATRFTFPSDLEIAMERVFDMLPDVPSYNLYGVMEMQQVDGGTMTFNCSALHSEAWPCIA
jgi:hypothetical protein